MHIYFVDVLFELKHCLIVTPAFFFFLLICLFVFLTIK